MRRIYLFFTAMIIAASLNTGCNQNGKPGAETKKDSVDTFKYLVEQFADVKILRYRIPGFEELTAQQKELLYYLSQASLSGRDIIWDQHYRNNLMIRQSLEAIVVNYKADKNSDLFKKLLEFTKRVWFSNGVHHHYSSDKMIPDFPKEKLGDLIRNTPLSSFPKEAGKTAEEIIATLTPLLFDAGIDPKEVCMDDGKDRVNCSSVNFYEGVTQKEVEKYYADMALQAKAALGKKGPSDEPPVPYGLNSKLIKENGKITEKTYKVGGMYNNAIAKMVYWLEKAITVAENEKQKKSLSLLVEYYKTGDLKIFNQYCIAWVQDTISTIDISAGFVEVYNDPMGMKGTYEATVYFKDKEATKRTEIIINNVQWFEDHSPIDPKFKKKKVKGVQGKVVTVVNLGGSVYPAPPVGINLPNSSWIRSKYGSKSVTLGNISHAFDQASLGSGALAEFAFSKEEIDLAKKFGALSGDIHTDMHECVGHASGKMNEGISGESLKNYHSVIEESRADLLALYYVMDPKMVELGLFPSIEVAKAEYNGYIRGAMLTQLVRIQPGKNIEQAHMRCRALISNWAYEKGMKEKVIEKKTKDGKTYFVVNSHEKLRAIFGEMLKEVQRITSEGDYNSARTIVEKYAVKVDPVLHKEVLARWKKLNISPYAAFINPVLEPVMKDGKMVDVKVSYPLDFVKQNLEYSKTFGLLPVKN